jgi:aryl-phospho-beta-D-glucosidase BglC (GH1 family)
VTRAQDVAARRAATLNRGINLSGWLGGWGPLTPEHVRDYTTAQDLKLIHDMGFEYVRLPFNPMPFQQMNAKSPERAAVLADLHRAVDLALASGLNVTICVFPNDQYKQQLFAGDDAVLKFVRVWRDLAESFSTSDPDRVTFEIMNEPEQSDPYRWVGIEGRVVEAIRSVAPNHTVIACGAHYSGLEDLLQTQPLADHNVIYAFHWYEPFYFTHQGATWTSDEVRDFRDVRYPSDPQDPAKMQPMLDKIPNLDARYKLFSYSLQRWDAATIADRIAYAAQWGKRFHVPVIANEFGAFKDTVAPAARARYVHDVRTAMEANGIGWAMWDYRGNFGVVDRTDSAIKPDDAVLAGLGLKTGIAAVTVASH